LVAEDSIEAQVRADIAALMSAHPMGEALAAMCCRAAATLDAGVQPMAFAGIMRELRETLLELSRMGVNGDDTFDADLSRPELPPEVRDAPES
jgi:hypothetical protein